MPYYTTMVLLACPCMNFEGCDEPCIMQKCVVCLSFINEMSVSYTDNKLDAINDNWMHAQTGSVCKRLIITHYSQI